MTRRRAKAKEDLFERLVLPPGLQATKVDFQWRGMEAHCAPDEGARFARPLLKKTNSALCTLGAACLVWSARRLEQIEEVGPLLAMAEVLLLWEDDPRYYHHPGESATPPRVAVTYHVVNALFYQASTILEEFPDEHGSDPPRRAILNLIAITSHILGKKWAATFQHWIEQTLKTLDEIAPNPHQDFAGRFDFDSDEAYEAHIRLNMGPPVPIEVCNPGAVHSLEQAALLYQDFMLKVVPTLNRYLATPELLMSKGFRHKPYTPKPRDTPKPIGKASGSRAASTKAASAKASGSKAASGKASGSKAASTKAASTKAANGKAAGSKAVSTKAAGSKAASSKAASGKAVSKRKPR